MDTRPTPIGQSFDRVICAARLGAEWAWVELYRCAAPAVSKYVHARGAADPENAIGDIFCKVVRRLATFSGDERAFRAWTLTIARYHLIDTARARQRHPVVPLDVDDFERSGPTGDVEDEAMTSLATDHVREVLSSLTSDQRDVLLLRIVGQLTIDEVAAAIGRRPGAVKMLQSRALASIRSRMSEGSVTL